jgi:hypothetical protein
MHDEGAPEDAEGWIFVDGDLVGHHVDRDDAELVASQQPMRNLLDLYSGGW